VDSAETQELPELKLCERVRVSPLRAKTAFARALSSFQHEICGTLERIELTQAETVPQHIIRHTIGSNSGVRRKLHGGQCHRSAPILASDMGNSIARQQKREEARPRHDSPG
jgi:hypothetical protein